MSDWSVEVTTDGGFTGRGIGSASTDSGEEAARAVAQAKPEQWKGEYGRGGPDRVRYTLTLTRAGQTYSASWYDGGEIPEDLAAIFNAVWSP